MKLLIPNNYKKAFSIMLSITDEVYIVGGFVRDLYTGKREDKDDVDVAVHGKHLKELTTAFEKSGYTINEDGLKFGVITVFIPIKNNDFEKLDIAQFRNEKYDTKSRKPIVQEADNIEDDLSRRDFTLGAIAYNVKTGKILDPFNGIKDIHNKIIRAVGNPDDRFKEDPLRILRGLRHAVKFGYTIEPKTFEAMKRNAYRLSIVSGERIRDELFKGLNYNSKEFFILLEKSGVLKELIKEFETANEIKHDSRHGHYNETLIEHIIDVLSK